MIRLWYFQYHIKSFWINITWNLTKSTNVRVLLLMSWTRLVWGGVMKSVLKLVILIRAIFEKLLWACITVQITLLQVSELLNIQFWQELLCSQWIFLFTLHFSLLWSSGIWNVVCNKLVKQWRLLNRIDRCSLMFPPIGFDCLEIPYSFHMQTMLILSIITVLEFQFVVDTEISVLESHLFLRVCHHVSMWWAQALCATGKQLLARSRNCWW